MNQLSLTRGALMGAAALLTVAIPGAADAQTYPPGTNCQSLLPGLRASCMDQAKQLNTGTAAPDSTMIPNSAGSNTVPTPGTSNSGVQPNGTISPNTVTPNGTVNPNAVGTPNSAPTGNNAVIIPPAIGTTGTGTSTGNE